MPEETPRYIEALSARARILDEFADAVFAKADVLHLPTVAVPAPTIEESDVGDSQALPALLLRLMHGEMADIDLVSAWMEPAKLRASGFEYDHPELEGALRAVLGRPLAM